MLFGNRAICILGCLLLFTCCGLANAEPDVETKETSAAVWRAATSQDIAGLLRVLPRIEHVWDQDPEEYLRLVRQAAPVLRSASTADAKAASMTLFAQVIRKRSPPQMDKSVTYFELKREIVLDYLNLDEIRGETTHLLDIATFVGEIRSRLIPDYTNRGTAQPGLHILIEAGARDAASLTDPRLKEAYAQAVKQNEQDMMMNDLQLALYRANQVLTFHLLHAAARFPVGRAETAEFVANLIGIAHLTRNEQAQWKP